MEGCEGLSQSSNKVALCNICGAAGFDNCLAKCCQCKDGAEHTYCMRTILDVVPTDWTCELCIIMQERTLSKKLLLYHDLKLGQACKKQVLRRVGKDARSLQSTVENKTDQLVSVGTEAGSAKSKGQLKVCPTFEGKPPYTNQPLHCSSVCLKTYIAASIIDDDCKEHVKKDLLCVSMNSADIPPKLQSEVNPAVTAQVVKNLAPKLESVSVKEGSAPAEQRDTKGFEFFFKPGEAERPSIKAEDKEETDGLEDILPHTKEISGGVFNGGTGTASKTPPVLTDFVTDSAGLEGISKSMDASTSISAHQCSGTGNVANDSCRQQQVGGENSFSILDYATVIQKIKQLGEPSSKTNFSESSSVSGINTHLASSMEQIRESVDHRRCASTNECPHNFETQEMQQTSKGYSRTGINRTTMALLKRISRRNIFPQKSHSAKFGKSGVSNQVTRGTNKNRPTSQTKKVKKKNQPIALSKAQVSSDCIMSPGSMALESQKVSFLPLGHTSGTIFPTSQVLIEAAGGQKHITDAGEALQAKGEIGQSIKVERGLPLLHQAKPLMMKIDCDKKQEDDAAMSVAREEGPHCIMPKTARGEVVSMEETTALHFKEDLETNSSADSCNSSLPLKYNLSVEAAAAAASAKDMSDSNAAQLDPKSGKEKFIEDVSSAKLSKKQAPERLLQCDAKVSTDPSSSLSDAEHSGSAQHHLSEHIAGGSRTSERQSTTREKWANGHVKVLGGILKDVLKVPPDKETNPGASTTFREADENHADKLLFCRSDVSPNKHASGMQVAVNRSMPVAAMNDCPSHGVDGNKGTPRKKVRFSIDEEDDMRRERRQSLKSARKDFKKKSLYARQSCKFSDHMERSPPFPPFRSRDSCMAGSNARSRALKFSRHTEGSRFQTCRSHTCEVGYSAEIPNAKSKNYGRDWEESNSQLCDRGTSERKSDLLPRNQPFDDSAFNDRHDLCNEAGHSTHFRELRGSDNLRDWGRRDSAGDDDRQMGWRRKCSVGYFDKETQWRRNESPVVIPRHNEWNNRDFPELVETSNDWRENENSALVNKQRDLRWKDTSDMNGQRGRQWGWNDALDMSAEDFPEKRTKAMRVEKSLGGFQRSEERDPLHNYAEDFPEERTNARHLKRCMQGFQGFAEKKLWRFGPRKENASSSSRSSLAKGFIDSSHKGPALVYRCSQPDKEQTFQWQLRDQAVFERESPGSDFIYPSKARKLDKPPSAQLLQYTKTHPKHVSQVQTKESYTVSQSTYPSRNYYVQERRALPSSQTLWNGCFDVTSKTRWSTIYKGIRACPSMMADPKVCEALLALPSELRLEEIKREEGNGSWPKAFQQCSPTIQSIGMYFGPQDMETDNTWYQPLVQHLNARGLALRSEMDSFQLLIYPSQLLPEAEQRWDGRLYLWGIFWGKKTSKVTVEDPRSRADQENGNDFGSPEASGEVIDMDIDMVGGTELVSENLNELSPPLPPGFAPPLPPPPLKDGHGF